MGTFNIISLFKWKWISFYKGNESNEKSNALSESIFFSQIKSKYSITFYFKLAGILLYFNLSSNWSMLF